MTGKAKRGLSLLLFFLLSASTASAYDLEKRVRSYTLKNGLMVLIVERHVSPTIACSIRHRVGAVDEENGKTGMAHLLEHMMFKGTKTIGTENYGKEEPLIKEIAAAGKALDREMMKGEKADAQKIIREKQRLKALQDRHRSLFTSSEIDRLYTEAGAVNANASTSQDLTTYHLCLPADKSELWARIESDRMRYPVFREFYTERDVVQEEWRQRIESDPEGTLYMRFFATAFTAHPYRRPVLGWPSEIRFLDPDDMKAFFRRFYAPNNTVIAIVGDVDPSTIMKTVEKYFGKIPAQGVVPRRATEEPPQQGERRIEVAFDANPELLMGWRKPAPPAFDDYVFEVIDGILSKGRTSRLYKALVEEKKQAEDIWTANGMPGNRYANLFAVFAAPRSPHTTKEVEESIKEEVEKLKQQPIGAQELQKVKNQIRADFIRGLDSNEGLAGILSYYGSLLGNYRYFTAYIAMIEKITPEDIMRVAKKYLRGENLTVATLARKGG